MIETFETIRDHIVILGWSERVRRILKELRSPDLEEAGETKPILIVTPEHDPAINIPYDRVYVIYGRTNDPEVLRRANLEGASMLLIPTQMREASTSDGESVFSLLAALTVNPSIRICVEIARADNGDTLEQIRQKNLQAGEIEIVSFETIAERLLAQAAINNGITNVFNELLQFGEGDEVYLVEVAPSWIGRTYRDLFANAFEQEGVLIGLETGGELLVNPKQRDYQFKSGDKVWVIAADKAVARRIAGSEEGLA